MSKYSIKSIEYMWKKNAKRLQSWEKLGIA